MYTREFAAVEQLLNSLRDSSWISWSISVLVYVFTAWSLYTIAKRRELRGAWLAWIPFGSIWLLGSLSDQYRYVARRQVCSKRKILLTLSIINFVLLMIGVVALVATVAGMFFGVAEMMMGASSDVLAHLTMPAVLLLLWAVVAIVYTVFKFMALYDVFISCDPANGVLFLVLSIFFGILRPIFLFVCRNKDCGMPPRRPQPVWQSTGGYQQPPMQPNYQPPTAPQDGPAPAESERPENQQ